MLLGTRGPRYCCCCCCPFAHNWAKAVFQSLRVLQCEQQTQYSSLPQCSAFVGRSCYFCLQGWQPTPFWGVVRLLALRRCHWHAQHASGTRSNMGEIGPLLRGDCLFSAYYYDTGNVGITQWLYVKICMHQEGPWSAYVLHNPAPSPPWGVYHITELPTSSCCMVHAPTNCRTA